MTESFPSDVAAKLKFYVYRLIDPRNGETFYVGKGKGNRVFSHIRAAEGLEGDDIGNKLSADPGDPARRLRGSHVIHHQVHLGAVRGLALRDGRGGARPSVETVQPR